VSARLSFLHTASTWAHHVRAGDDVEAAGGVAEGVVGHERLASRDSLVDGVPPLADAQRLAKVRAAYMSKAKAAK